MKTEPTRMLLLTMGLLVLAGCGRDESAPPAASSPTVVNAPAPPPPPPPSAPAPAAPAATSETPAATVNAPPPAPPAESAAPGDASAAAPKAPEPERQKAEVGVGPKGHYQQGILTTPLSIYFRAEERVTFNIKIPKAMELFKATENRLPKSHEEFMQRIIKDNDIRLPQLPGSRRYVYDPKTGELMVEQRQP